MMRHLRLGPVAKMFSGRESQVVEGLLEGLTAQQIATCLGLTQAAISFHLGRIYRKLDATNQRQAMARLMDLGCLCHPGQDLAASPAVAEFT
jgi:DNA-binding CsgD family transcriptional regulator